MCHWAVDRTEGRSKSGDEPRATLVSALHHPMDARITITNTGNAPAAPSKLTLDCIKLGAPVQMNSCPDLPPSFAGLYFDPSLPKNATIRVPALAPGETFTHTLVFCTQLNWPKGKYKFIAVADAAHNISLSTTKENVATSTFVVP